MLPGPAVPDSCLASFHFLWAIHPIRPVVNSCTDLFLKRPALPTSPPRALEALPLADFRLEVPPRAGEARRQARLGGLPRAADGCGERERTNDFHGVIITRAISFPGIGRSKQTVVMRALIGIIERAHHNSLF